MQNIDKPIPFNLTPAALALPRPDAATRSRNLGAIVRALVYRELDELAPAERALGSGWNHAIDESQWLHEPEVRA